MIIGLLSFSRSLATKCLSLNKEPCKTKPFLIDLFSYFLIDFLI